MLSFTKQERQVILFLIAITLLGIGVDFFMKINSKAKIMTCLGQNIGRIDLNKADKETLMGVPGIGEKLAQRIIDYRDKQGEIKNIEELRDIKGITNNKFEKLKELVYAQ